MLDFNLKHQVSEQQNVYAMIYIAISQNVLKYRDLHFYL